MLGHQVGDLQRPRGPVLVLLLLADDLLPLGPGPPVGPVVGPLLPKHLVQGHGHGPGRLGDVQPDDLRGDQGLPSRTLFIDIHSQ